MNDPLYNHVVFGPEKGKGGRIGKTDEQLIQDLISIHNAENWLGLDEEGGGVGVGPLSAIAVVSQQQQHIGGGSADQQGGGVTKADKGTHKNDRIAIVTQPLYSQFFFFLYCRFWIFPER